MPYAVIAITQGWKEKRTYTKVSSKPYSIEDARTLRDTIDDGTNKPLIVDECRVAEAIELNNKGL
jgi:hypothetical protein